MEWISVQDELPKEEKEYLVYYKPFGSTQYIRDIAVRYKHKPAVYDRTLDPYFLVRGKVTYWSELLESPE